MDELQKEIEQVASRHGKLAEVDYLASYILSFLAVVGSITASIFAALDFGSKEILAVLAVIPAAVLSLKGTFKFEEKAIWHFRKSHKLQALTRSLRFEGAEPSVVSKSFSDVEQDLDDQWPRFVKTEKGKESNST